MKVGLFVFIGLVLLAALLIQFSKGTSLFRGTYILHLHAANVGGLKTKAGVLLAGVPVGSVHEIQLDASGTNVTIILQIYKEFPIYHDARFVIEQSGFLGDQFVSVIPTDQLAADPGQRCRRGLRGAVQPAGSGARRGGLHPAAG